MDRRRLAWEIEVSRLVIVIVQDQTERPDARAAADVDRAHRRQTRTVGKNHVIADDDPRARHGHQVRLDRARAKVTVSPDLDHTVVNYVGATSEHGPRPDSVDRVVAQP
jgi:hypothetical protein